MKGTKKMSKAASEYKAGEKVTVATLGGLFAQKSYPGYVVEWLGADWVVVHLGSPNGPLSRVKASQLSPAT